MVEAPRVLRLPMNERGRDFVVGDIHGAYDYVLQAMGQVGFDPACDRVISVGDLVDRGAGSWRCAKFLDQPYVHAARGNHEDMLLDMYANGEPPAAALRWAAERNGLGWWLQQSPENRREILARFERLPIAIELGTPRGLVGFVHADVPDGLSWQDFLARLEAGDPPAIQTALWGRTRVQSENCRGVPGVGRVFVGHTPRWGGLQRYGNVYAVDTGAVFAELGIQKNGRLTFADVMTKTSVLAAPLPHVLVDVRVDLARDEEGTHAPFGHYVKA